MNPQAPLERQTPVDPRPPLVISGILFFLFACVHIWRIANKVSIVIGTTVVPFWASGIVLIISLLLALWMFWAAANSGRRYEPERPEPHEHTNFK